jgi:CheY-like chemotaxis protein
MNTKIPFLFVDDSNSDNKYLSLFIRIKKLPIEPTFESNGQQGIHYLHTCGADNFPKVIFVDINMPLMNGFEFADKYQRIFAANHPETLVFITSSSIQISDLERANSHPIVSGFIEKPFNLKQFETKVQPLLNGDEIAA